MCNEIKPGAKTTEFRWAFLAVTVLIAVLTALQQIRPDWAATLESALAIAYMISRGLSKSGGNG